MSTSKTRRTSMEEISDAGCELSDEHLQLAVGGLRRAGTFMATVGPDGRLDSARIDSSITS